MIYYLGSTAGVKIVPPEVSSSWDVVIQYSSYLRLSKVEVVLVRVIRFERLSESVAQPLGEGVPVARH